MMMIIMLTMMTFHERLFAVVDGEAVELLYFSRIGLAFAVTAHCERVLRDLHAST